MMMETIPSGTILNGHYRIERALGSGGFGHVYLAIDTATNQQYALKEYFVTGANGQVQLQHEARVLTQLHHPNLPAFHDAFTVGQHYYIVLSYVEGRDLTDIIRTTRLRNEVIPLPTIMGWVLSICDAVDFLHQQQPQIIHRDIKPDNIRIMPDGTAILVDLGNAKATADGARTLFFIRHQGTPGYAPLEQYPGGTGTDARSDIYALGGTLYFALTTHEPPSVSTRTQAAQQGIADLPSLQDQVTHNPPLERSDPNPPRQYRAGSAKQSKQTHHHIHQLAQLGTLPPNMLNQLNSIIQRAMAMKPKERYQSVTAMSNDLKLIASALAAAPPLAPTPTPRPVDPYSTQPDLQKAYDAIVEASETRPKENESPARSAPSQTPNEAITLTCRQCGAPVVAQASYCPRCGSALKSLPRTEPPEEPRAIVNMPSPQNKVGAGLAPALESTPPIGSLHMNAASNNANATLPIPSTTPWRTVEVSAPAQNGDRPNWVPQTHTENVAPSSTENRGHGALTAGSPSFSRTVEPAHSRLYSATTLTRRRSRQVRNLLIMLLILIMLVGVVTWFAISLSAGQPHGSSRKHPKGAHERNYTLSFISVYTHPTTGIRQCSQGFCWLTGQA